MTDRPQKTAAKPRAGASRNRVKLGTSKAEVAARWKLFAEAFIANGGNGTRAAIEAGFSERAAQEKASQLLTKPEVQQLIQAQRDALAKKYELTTDAVIQSLARVIHFDPRALFHPDGDLKRVVDLDEDVAAVLTGIETIQLGSHDAPVFIKKLKWESKATAREQAMKHLGLFEKDNKQKAGLLGELSRPEIEAIRDRLAEISRQRG